VSERFYVRHFPADAFGKPWRQHCLNDPCQYLAIIEGQRRTVFRGGKLTTVYEPGLWEGCMYVCGGCRTTHEFYITYISGPTPGLRVRMGTVRAHIRGSDQTREQGEPTVGEFAVD
jgi:hypothetical protein